MKVGDMVMFVDDGRYAKWFFGQLATVIHYTPSRGDIHGTCRVRWLQPVKYHDGYATVSDFSVGHFHVMI